jgi:hypothetical protein
MKSKVERVALALRDQLVERRHCGADAQIDLVRDTGLHPMRLADRSPLDRHVAGDQTPVAAHRFRDRERRVAGERADLECAPHARQLYDQLHERGLLGRDLHHRHRKLGRLVDELLLHFVDRLRVREQVAVDLGIQEEGLRGVGHVAELTAPRHAASCAVSSG